MTESVRRRPYQIVLFDEFEKAHPSVSNILLQVLDEGHLTDSHGRRVDFKNTIIILTSNIGAQTMAGLPEGVPSSQAATQVMKEVQQRLAPEFINRLDEIVLFNRLGRPAIRKIVDLLVHNIQTLLAEQRITLDVDVTVREHVAQAGFSDVYGARPLKRLLQSQLLNRLAVMLLNGSIRENENVRVEMRGDELFVVPNHDPVADIDELPLLELEDASKN